jgi:hypothetical protein
VDKGVAANEKMRLGELVRMLLREGVSAKRAPDRRLFAELAEIRQELRGMAINMNQIARRSNTFSDLPLEAETLAELAQLGREAGRVLNLLSDDIRRFVAWRD